MRYVDVTLPRRDESRHDLRLHLLVPRIEPARHPQPGVTTVALDLPRSTYCNEYACARQIGARLVSGTFLTGLEKEAGHKGSSTKPAWKSLSGPMRYVDVTLLRKDEGSEDVRLALRVPRIGPPKDPQAGFASGTF